MFLIVVQAILLYLPAGIANMMPVIFDKIGLLKSLAVPIDSGHKIGGDHIFGTHKTYRGILSGIFGGILAGFLLKIFSDFIIFRFCLNELDEGMARDCSYQLLSLFGYFTFQDALAWGALIGFGALMGDLMKSFFKRRLHIRSGAAFFPFDQLDSLIGALVFGSLIYVPPWPHIVALFILTPLLHFLTNVLAYTFKLKKVWW